MESERIKEIWKVNSVKEIDNYTDSQIMSIILKTARKAIDHSFRGVIFWASLILFDLTLLWFMLKYSTTQEGRVYVYVITSLTMVLIFVAICLSEWGRRKAKHYSYDISLKEWLENNIRDFDKSIVRLKKSWFLKYGFGMLFLSIFIILRIFIVGLDHMIVLLAYAVGLTSMIIASKIGTRATLRRMEKSRSGLQELYDQLYDR